MLGLARWSITSSGATEIVPEFDVRLIYVRSYRVGAGELLSSSTHVVLMRRSVRLMSRSGIPAIERQSRWIVNYDSGVLSPSPLFSAQYILVHQSYRQYALLLGQGIGVAYRLRRSLSVTTRLKLLSTRGLSFVR